MVGNIMFGSSLPIDYAFWFRSVPIKFGLSVLKEIGYDVSKLGVKKALIVTDSFLKENTNVVEGVVSSLRDKNVEVDVWDGVEPEPSHQSILKGIDFAKKKPYDCFIGLGGGSAIDTAKAINLYTTYPTDFLDYFAQPFGRGLKVPGPLKPLIAVPTTSGTGSETTSVAVVSFPEKKVKFGISDDYLRPTMAILDPLVTFTMPQKVTATTGMDALMHALEAYTTIPYNTRPMPSSIAERPVYCGSNPLTDTLAESAITLIGKYLPKAYSNGNDLESRSNMHVAATIAGLAFGNAGVHICHALSYPIAGEALEKNIKVPHGLAVSITAPATFRSLTPYLVEKIGNICYLFGYKEYDVDIYEIITNFMRILDFPNGLSELGFRRSDLHVLAEKALLQKRLIALSPIAVNVKFLERVLEDSMVLW
ncbi:MAG: iron-containing alcohol dehydrogenase [Nitrososphaeria archaeon]|nr:iron-containing alcohol dehydrogenase [Nitrososphaeria archaeon]